MDKSPQEAVKMSLYPIIGKMPVEEILINSCLLNRVPFLNELNNMQFNISNV